MYPGMLTGRYLRAGCPGFLAGAADWLYASAMTAEGEPGSEAAQPPQAAAPDPPDVQVLEESHGDPAGRVSDGIACLEQAIAAFSEAAESGDAEITPLAIELLARTLPLREREEESAQVWQHGLDHADPVIAAAVRQRLRRAFGSDEATAEPAWWESFVEAAVCHSTLPLLANEVFGALDHIYALAAVPLARGGSRARELRDVLAQAVRVPAGYVWGGDLEASFRERFRDVTGADGEEFPDG